MREPQLIEHIWVSSGKISNEHFRLAQDISGMIAEGIKILSARIACSPASSMAGTKMFLKYRSNGGPNGVMTKQVSLDIFALDWTPIKTSQPLDRRPFGKSLRILAISCAMKDLQGLMR